MSATLDKVVPVLCSMLVALGGLAEAQSMADAARKAREARAGKRTQAARSYTETDLAEKRAETEESEPTTAPPPAPEAKPTPLTGSVGPSWTRLSPPPPPPEETTSSTADAEERERARQEAYWRKRMEKAHARVEKAEARLAQEAQTAQRALGSCGLDARRRHAEAQGRVAAAQEELDQARQALEDLPDEARRAGALPGWLR